MIDLLKEIRHNPMLWPLFFVPVVIVAGNVWPEALSLFQRRRVSPPRDTQEAVIRSQRLRLTARAFDVRKLIKQGELAIGKPFNLKVR
jgi:hypothetical protein